MRCDFELVIDMQTGYFWATEFPRRQTSAHMGGFSIFNSLQKPTKINGNEIRGRVVNELYHNLNSSTPLTNLLWWRIMTLLKH
jgi:hypothetical protein